MAIQRGRKSPHWKPLVRSRAPLVPPPILTVAEKSLFSELAAANQHLNQTDVPLAAAYIQALTKLHKLAKGNQIRDWERAARVALSIGTKLRLTPQSTQDPQALGRRRADYHSGRAPWED